ncbi:MAG: SDR family NAD(P)-dependent oxidoreductase [Acidiferrobacterales bacterium]|nr:SDR family NAD(P)-dependent oxidoreductase [Acidiferrobacterales bacterium]
MSKTILITGATDGIGIAAAQLLVEQGHKLLIHGRSAEKLASARQRLEKVAPSESIDTYQADLSSLSETSQLAKQVLAQHSEIDVLVNNAGVFKTPVTTTDYGIDVRVVVNTIAPYQLTVDLIKGLGSRGRVINLSSAAQAPIKLPDFFTQPSMNDMDAYSQSKLAIIMWTRHLVIKSENKPVMIAVNPGSLLASKMVKEGFGVEGKDVGIGAKIIAKLAVDPAHQDNSGKYFDNDTGQFFDPHPAGLDDAACAKLVDLMDDLIVKHQT